MNLKELFQTGKTILVIDFPSKDVPESLVRARFDVIVHEGPGIEEYTAYEMNNGEVISRRRGRGPEEAELIFAHRPLNELPDIIKIAKALHAKTVWTQSGLSSAGKSDATGCWVSDADFESARDLVQAAGLKYIAEPYIGDVARSVG